MLVGRGGGGTRAEQGLGPNSLLRQTKGHSDTGSVKSILDAGLPPPTIDFG